MGKVDFPTSGLPGAQSHFQRGVAALHSFWYAEALEAFQTALRIDPDFAMAWWGVAMACHHPYFSDSDDEAGRQALAKIRDTSALTARERAYIDALRTWYADGTTPTRATAYAGAMRKVQQAYPEDQEAALFYALSLLGHDWSDGGLESRQQAAGALAQEVYARQPNHPGAAHYLIHSFDDPALAIRALPAARHYATIAPDAPHALHMPSHIFLQLGMWAETVASNEAAWTASEAWGQRKRIGPALRDYHSLHWLVYACLQQGRHARAAELVDQFRSMRKDIPPEGIHFFNRAVAAFVVETRNWDRADALFASDLSPPLAPVAAPAGPRRNLEFCGSDPAPAAATSGVPPADVPSFIRALAAAEQGAPDADQRLNDLHARAGGNAIPEFWRIRVLEVAAVSNARDGAFGAAIAALRQATALEEELGQPSGPPMACKPPHELLGEVLLRAGQPDLAAVEFRKNLIRHPNRALSLLGCARAEEAMGDRSAARASYSRLLEIWNQADKDLPELREAREYLQAIPR